jgi:hypothetical protein
MGCRVSNPGFLLSVHLEGCDITSCRLLPLRRPLTVPSRIRGLPNRNSVCAYITTGTGNNEIYVRSIFKRKLNNVGALVLMEMNILFQHRILSLKELNLI